MHQQRPAGGVEGYLDRERSNDATDILSGAASRHELGLGTDAVATDSELDGQRIAAAQRNGVQVDRAA